MMLLSARKTPNQRLGGPTATGGQHPGRYGALLRGLGCVPLDPRGLVPAGAGPLSGGPNVAPRPASPRKVSSPVRSTSGWPCVARSIRAALLQRRRSVWYLQCRMRWSSALSGGSNGSGRGRRRCGVRCCPEGVWRVFLRPGVCSQRRRAREPETARPREEDWSPLPCEFDVRERFRQQSRTLICGSSRPTLRPSQKAQSTDKDGCNPTRVISPPAPAHRPEDR